MQITLKDNIHYSPTRTVADRHHLTNYIGNTPLIELHNIAKSVAPVKIYAKAEWYNPGGSIKDRAAYNMMSAYEISRT